MDDKWPLANGNYSTAANWNDGTLPVDGDIIYLDGRTITLDVDIDLPNAELRSTQRSGGTVGGSLVWSVNVVRAIRLKEVLAGSSIPIVVSGSGGLAVGAGVIFQGSNTANVRALQHGGTGNLTFGAGCEARNGTGGSTAQGVGVVAVCSVSGFLNAICSENGSAEAVLFSATDTVDLEGAIQHGRAATTISFNTAVGTWTITEETCVGSITTNGNKLQVNSASFVFDRQSPEVFEFPSTWLTSHLGVQANSLSVEYRGDLIQPVANAPQLYNLATSGVFRHRGTLYGCSVWNGNTMVYGSTAGGKTVIDKLAPHPVSGRMPVLGPGWYLRSDSEIVASTESANVTLVSSTEVGDPPAVTDVRDGVAYHFDTLEGTLKVPNPNTVSIGVATDNTTGTYIPSVTVSPLQASATQRVVATSITTYVGETITVGPIAITDAAGDPVDLTGKTLRVVIESPGGADLAIVASGSIDVTGDDDNQISFAAPIATTESPTGRSRWRLEDTADGNRFLAGGNWVVLDAARAAT